jgi:hypothetical protein
VEGDEGEGEPKGLYVIILIYPHPHPPRRRGRELLGRFEISFVNLCRPNNYRLISKNGHKAGFGCLMKLEDVILHVKKEVRTKRKLITAHNCVANFRRNA